MSLTIERKNNKLLFTTFPPNKKELVIMILKTVVKLQTTMYFLALTLIASMPAAAQQGATNALDTASTQVQTNILQGNWRVIFVAVAIMAAGFLFTTGKLAWYWALAIIFGASLIAGAETFAAWIFSWWA